MHFLHYGGTTPHCKMCKSLFPYCLIEYSVLIWYSVWVKGLLYKVTLDLEVKKFLNGNVRYQLAYSVFRIADHVRADICNRPCLCLVQALLKTPPPSVDRPLATSERRP